LRLSDTTFVVAVGSGWSAPAGRPGRRSVPGENAGGPVGCGRDPEPTPAEGPGPVPGARAARATLAARAAALRAEIAEHNRRYHELDAPTISDADYDDLVRELRALEEQFPELVEGTPTATVGAAPSATFAPVRAPPRP
jgi:hypothetical protein